MADSKIWFILSNGQVTGPYDSTEIENNLSSATDPLIWGRTVSEWMVPAKWRQAQQSLQKAKADAAPESIWKVRVEGIEKAPLKYSELIAYLKTLTDFSSVDIRPDSSSLWKEIYAFPQIADDLGISRRSHPRVPIVGKLVCELPAGPKDYRVISISEGGLGLTDASDLKIGQRFKGILTSANLFITITSDCEVVYAGNDGYVGLRFIGLPEEFKSSIIEYVNKFSVI